MEVEKKERSGVVHDLIVDNLEIDISEIWDRILIGIEKEESEDGKIDSE